jgi:hypothetical protein
MPGNTVHAGEVLTPPPGIRRVESMNIEGGERIPVVWNIIYI